MFTPDRLEFRVIEDEPVEAWEGPPLCIGDAHHLVPAAVAARIPKARGDLQLFIGRLQRSSMYSVSTRSKIRRSPSLEISPRYSTLD